MAQIIQPVSMAHTQGDDVSFSCYLAVKEAKTNARENIQLLDSLCDSLSNLCTNLDRLDDLTESIFFCKDKEKSSPQAEPFD